MRIVEGPWGVVGSGSFTVKINDDGLPPRAELMPAPLEGVQANVPEPPPAVPQPPLILVPFPPNQPIIARGGYPAGYGGLPTGYGGFPAGYVHPH